DAEARAAGNVFRVGRVVLRGRRTRKVVEGDRQRAAAGELGADDVTVGVEEVDTGDLAGVGRNGDGGAGEEDLVVDTARTVRADDLDVGVDFRAATGNDGGQQLALFQGFELQARALGTDAILNAFCHFGLFSLCEFFASRPKRIIR